MKRPKLMVAVLFTATIPLTLVGCIMANLDVSEPIKVWATL